MATSEPVPYASLPPAAARRLHEQIERLACPSFDFVTELTDSFAEALTTLGHYHPHLPHWHRRHGTDTGEARVTTDGHADKRV